METTASPSVRQRLQTPPLRSTTTVSEVQPAGSTRIVMTDYRFTPGSTAPATATAGTARFYLVNSPNSSDVHNMAIRSASGELLARSAVVLVDTAAVFTVEQLPAGRYMVLCELPGHAQAGMVGTLDVP
jgi:plastocyanin